MQLISQRVGRYLERQGLLEQDTESSWLGISSGAGSAPDARYYRQTLPPGGTIIRAMAAKLLPGGVITPPRANHPSFHYGHRIPIPYPKFLSTGNN